MLSCSSVGVACLEVHWLIAIKTVPLLLSEGDGLERARWLRSCGYLVNRLVFGPCTLYRGHAGQFMQMMVSFC